MRRRLLLLLAQLLLVAPVDAQTRWRLVEVARVGGADEGLASFNEIIDLQLSDDGKLWVLDRQSQSLRLFAADGTPIREVARRGRGPGELSNANGVRRGADGRIWVRDHSNQRIVAFAPDGSVREQVMAPSFGYGWRWDGVVDGDGQMLEMIGVQRGEERVGMLQRRSADGARADTVAMPGTCSELPKPVSAIRGRSGFATRPFAPRYMTVIAADGAVWCAHSDEYSVRRFAFGAARHDRQLTLSAPRVPIPRAERDTAIAQMQRTLIRIGGAVEPWDPSSVPRDRGALRWFEEDDTGRLWVLRQRPDQRFEFDVWDRVGRRIAIVDAPPLNDYFPLYRIVNGRLVAVILDEDELPVVVIFQIQER